MSSELQVSTPTKRFARKGAAPAPADTQLPELHELIVWAQEQSSRMGYFAALYFHVGRAVELALAQNKFEHPEELRRLNDAFFHRYKVAFVLYRDGGVPTPAWEASFRAAAQDDLCVMQHLMLGVNAHINFDLAISVADTIDPADLPAFRADFEYMNAILASLVNAMEDDLMTVFAPLKWILKLFRRESDVIVEFSMRIAREEAWRNVVRLSKLSGKERELAIDKLDREATEMARIVIQKGFPTSRIMRWIQRHERGSVPQIIDDLLAR